MRSWLMLLLGMTAGREQAIASPSSAVSCHKRNISTTWMHDLQQPLRHVEKGLAESPRLLTRASIPGLPLKPAWRGLQRQHRINFTSTSCHERCPRERLDRREVGVGVGQQPVVPLDPAHRRC